MYCNFTDHRITFTRGNFIHGNRGSKVARMDEIFIHEQHNEKRLFASLTDVDDYDDGVQSRDVLLDLPLLKLSTNRRIIGLPAINAAKLYIVDLNHDARLVWVNWTIQFM